MLFEGRIGGRAGLATKRNHCLGAAISIYGCWEGFRLRLRFLVLFQLRLRPF